MASLGLQHRWEMLKEQHQEKLQTKYRLGQTRVVERTASPTLLNPRAKQIFAPCNSARVKDSVNDVVRADFPVDKTDFQTDRFEAANDCSIQAVTLMKKPYVMKLPVNSNPIFPGVYCKRL